MADSKRKPKFTQRESLGLRVSPDLKKKLDAAAARRGTSQSTEAAIRLDQSFERVGLLPEVLELAYGRQLAGILMLLGVVMDDVGVLADDRRRRSIQDWADNPRAYELALQAAIALLIALRPPGDAPEISPRLSNNAAQILQECTQAVRPGSDETNSAFYTHPPSPPYCDAQTIRALLGPIAGRIGDPVMNPAAVRAMSRSALLSKFEKDLRSAVKISEGSKS